MPQSQPTCYATMFPDLARMEYNEPCQGKAVTVEVRSWGIGAQSRELTVNSAEWDKCVACPEYRTCYDLSLAKLQLARALAAF